jgi:hypothetical protein
MGPLALDYHLSEQRHRSGIDPGTVKMDGSGLGGDGRRIRRCDS